MATICCWKALKDMEMGGIVCVSDGRTPSPIWEEKDCPFHGGRKHVRRTNREE